MNDIPRRLRTDLYTPAETAIRAAIIEVEKVGADVRLTEAVNLLARAQRKVADYVDAILPRKVGDAIAKVLYNTPYNGTLNIPGLSTEQREAAGKAAIEALQKNG